MNLSDGDPFAVLMYLLAVGLQCFRMRFSKDGFIVMILNRLSRSHALCIFRKAPHTLFVELVHALDTRTIYEHLGHPFR